MENKHVNYMVLGLMVWMVAILFTSVSAKAEEPKVSSDTYKFVSILGLGAGADWESLKELTKIKKNKLEIAKKENGTPKASLPEKESGIVFKIDKDKKSFKDKFRFEKRFKVKNTDLVFVFEPVKKTVSLVFEF